MSAEPSALPDGDTVPGATESGRAPAPRPRARLNALAIAAVILAALLSPLAALFGHIALVQITRSQGRERGAVAARIAIALGYLWLVALFLVSGGVLLALDGGLLTWP